jgi:allantoin racemase
MKILFINPNTSESFTKRIEETARQHALPTTEVVAKTATSGPSSIECIYDEALSLQGTLSVAIEEMNNVEGIVIACYSDHPAVAALREITDIPVLGIAEASMYTACLLGRKFSVVTTNREWEPLLWDAVRRYGLSVRCASVRTTNLPVLALESAPQDEIYQLILRASHTALEEDGADVICLGCAGMAGLDQRLSQDLSVPVLDGVVCALKLLEGLVSIGAKTSKSGAYTYPRVKPLANLPKEFSRGYKDRNQS